MVYLCARYECACSGVGVKSPVQSVIQPECAGGVPRGDEIPDERSGFIHLAPIHLDLRAADRRVRPREKVDVGRASKRCRRACQRLTTDGAHIPVFVRRVARVERRRGAGGHRRAKV